MKRFCFVGIALATTLAIAPAAKADSTAWFWFNITGVPTGSSNGIDGTGITGSGHLSSVSLGNGSFAVTGGSIKIGGGPLGGTVSATVIPTATPGVPEAFPESTIDDILSPSPLPKYNVDVNGLLFQLPGDLQLVIFFDAGGDVLYTYNTSTEVYTPLGADGWNVDANFVPDVPEPSSLLLLGTGLSLLAGLLFWSRKPNALKARTSLGA